jgi:hypothetical protein
MSAREAYIAGFSGAPKYKGSTTNESFKAGQDSRKVFNRRSKYKDWGDRKYQTGAGKRWDQKLGKKIKKFFDKTGEGIMGPYHAMTQAGKELFLDPVMKAAENRKIMGDLYKDKEYRENLKKSLMTGFGLRKGQEGYEGSNQEFYDKYTKLAGLASDNQERERLQGIADTAWGNAQISSRLNYALGQLGYNTMGEEGFASYQPDFTGGEGTGFEEGASPRFNMDNFLSGLMSTKAGKDFYNEALEAQANETGDTLISNAMKSFGSPRATFTSPAEMNREIQDYNNAISVEDIMPIEGVSNQLNIDAYNEIMDAPFNATDIYSNLSFPFIRNKVFPGMNLEDITQEDLDNLSTEDKIYLGYTG